MLTALSVTTAAAILAVGGSLALIGSQLAPSERPAVEPAALTSPSPAPEPTPDPAVGVRVKGTGGGAVLEYGDIAGTELRDRVATTLYIVADDPRVMGEDRFVHHADNHDGVGPEWGAYRLENADGAWQGVLTGYFDGPETRLNGWLTGEGAYDGLTYYLEYVLDNYSFQVDIEGIIYPGEPPSDPPAVEPWELAARVTSE